MRKITNLQMFINNYNFNVLPTELKELILFTSYSNTLFNLPLFKNITKSDTNNQSYIFHYNGNKYRFEIFSNFKLQKYDIEILRNPRKRQEQCLRSLKLACSMDLINPRIGIGNSIFGPFELLILYQEHGIDKVIDYARNIVMNKEEYYKIFNFEEFNIIDKYDLYNIYYIINELDDYEHLYVYLTFTKEIFNEISKNNHFSFLNKKYNELGMHNNNYTLLGTDHDCLFFQESDSNPKYKKIIDELTKFTENPSTKTKHISHDKEKNIYKLKEKSFGYFTFDLLSDMIDDNEMHEKLLSDSRYHKCHEHAILVASCLHEKDKKNTYVVGGQCRGNEIDYYHHSWIEVNNTVIDFNHNIIMNKKKYYKLFEAEEISKTSIYEIEEIIEFISYELESDWNPFDIVYFGKEFMKDLKKNKKTFKKS